MARDPKWAVNDAVQAQSISKISIDENREKELLSAIKKAAFGMFIGSIVLLVVAFGIVAALAAFAGVIFYSVKMVIAYIIVIIFPIYAVYNIIHTNSAIKKGDYDFYQGQIVTKTDKGFKVAGLEELDLSFIKNKTDGDKKDNVKPGDIVKIMRIDNDLSLFL